MQQVHKDWQIIRNLVSMGEYSYTLLKQVCTEEDARNIRDKNDRLIRQYVTEKGLKRGIRARERCQSARIILIH